MKDFDVVYVDQDGNKKSFVVTSIDTNTAIASALDLRSDCRRVVRCSPKSISKD